MTWMTYVEFCESKIAHFDLEGISDKHIMTLDVPVDNS